MQISIDRNERFIEVGNNEDVYTNAMRNTTFGKFLAYTEFSLHEQSGCCH
uniref:Uncharacterized protein n=1 Tax=Candidatus Kentrum sp. LPFa TaxID=2126335 RepID=A0A450X2D4_9GAMM|nr:MAG: hypothetical protein BECKLPF1236A_GA0070988_103794 [Candidatus Kentron sp. LPFa]VFK35518.1 MAG: hypothetical protein BECKLPF1236C_GA0070990_103844 [Candidatus Kentron sp. LPFa]